MPLAWSVWIGFVVLVSYLIAGHVTGIVLLADIFIIMFFPAMYRTLSSAYGDSPPTTAGFSLEVTDPPWAIQNLLKTPDRPRPDQR